ncbi:helix-turn-helix transcriptional regulator [Lentzea sp. BCCO 10_0798]|jgi:transcriptional regulator with XRE-family HTH domain|uniref:Helix-turn-helix transcriptional regulator n=1 Tax=Lentzea kristufekii TaxID=3095430 RepID=A0ABU4TXY6_9PSEU|nr:helix-turn-helix transcriptional regulator [Lentzea sp. BCCO 10_0798]MDX8052681.1 helix-turn-helix transcriptional regulator [Lentzea sp. BCCO 10_0798]
MDVDPRTELSEFLRSRRARLSPDDVGLPRYGRTRRVPGLRREELAQLAGVSVAYYTRLEQGNGRNVSDEVLDSIARALQLNEAEQTHLRNLTACPYDNKKKKKTSRGVRPALKHLLDNVGVPAYIGGRRSDVLAWNPMAAALFGDWAELEPRERNWARFIFLQPSYQELFVNWESKAADVVGFLRMDAGCYPNDPELTALIGELSVKSELFRQLWAKHDVKEKSFGTKMLRHPLVGEMTLAYETLRMPSEPDLFFTTYHAEPGTPSAEALQLLASWGKDATRSGESVKNRT